MKRVIRHLLDDLDGAQFLRLPNDAKLLTVDNIDNRLALVFIADADKPDIDFEFYVAAHSGNVPDWCSKESYVTSVNLRWKASEWLLLHVFEFNRAGS